VEGNRKELKIRRKGEGGERKQDEGRKVEGGRRKEGGSKLASSSPVHTRKSIRDTGDFVISQNQRVQVLPSRYVHVKLRKLV
jgi:hypothetical protein